MNESQHLRAEYIKLFNGSPWIDVNIMSTLSPLTASQASAKPFSNANSIWEIVNHLISWRKTVLKRVLDETIPSPESNYFEPVTDSSVAAWQQTLQQLEESQTAWLATLADAAADWLEKVPSSGNWNRYELILGILQHDAYHLGQIVILRKFIWVSGDQRFPK